MNIVEMYDLVKKIYTENESEYYYIGLRFEDKVREIGEVIEDCSRHNFDREDEREFPAFGSDDYEELQVLDGTSAWDMSVPSTYKISPHVDRNKDCTLPFLTDHCYVIAGNKQGRHDDPDVGEIVIKDAVVIATIF